MESAMRRRSLLVLLAGLAMVVAALEFVLWPRPDRITHENFDRIRAGMTMADVEAILGGPPGEYRTGPTVRGNAPLAEVPAEVLRTEVDEWDLFWDSADADSDPFEVKPFGSTWGSDQGIAVVCFDDEGRAHDRWYVDRKRVEQTTFEHLLWRAKRQWRRWFP
jgi:hypothetical protein